ncbi:MULTISPECIES: hypothetical protein [unclassified Pseudomonas]|uniref:hypothetical protein n=1 Tax=unclassified Pseudomonas TaxID=196821 RepID=UPI0021C6F0A8|nr:MULTISPECIES: hypothetical protein [unclassified Pseudomonas]MCU1733728.1 hypothetical protein [Pseudomonas sp. 20P_3.2_Bac4]MCU1744701.1 hypothetical protein [Pseudomonas sp. 20P_3.2_Bac5]
MDNSNPFPALIAYFAAKRAMFQQEKHSITRLALGSSHGDFAFDPAYCPGAFNLCSRSQDFRHSLALYQYAASQAPSLDTLIVFYSLFSPGNVLEQSPSEKTLAPLMNEVFRLGQRYDDTQLMEIAAQLEGRLEAIDDTLGGKSGFLPQHQKGFMPADYSVQQRVEDHLRLNRKEDGNQYLAQLLMLAAERGHRVLLVIPPMHRDYQAVAGPDSPHLFRGAFELQQLMDCLRPGFNMNILDCYADADFVDEHFGDYDHLLPEGDGAPLLSTKIAQSITTS